MLYIPQNINGENETCQSVDMAVHNIVPAKPPKTLTKEQEYELGYKAFRGDIEARDKLINANYGLVVKIARNYVSSGASFEDLYQEGCLGLTLAAEKFNPEKNCRFSTYATYWIKKYIFRSSVRSGLATKIPRRIEPYINKVLSYYKMFEVTSGREPLIEEIAENTGVSPNIVRDIISFSKPHIEYDDRICSSCDSPSDLLSDDEKFVVSKLMQQKLDEIFDCVLTEKEKYILRSLYLGDNCVSKKALSLELGVHVSQVTTVEKKAFEKIRTYFNKKGIDFHDFFSN